MPRYGQATYGLGIYGQESAVTTFTPTWAPASAPVVGRGAGQLLDLAFGAGALGRDARGGVALVSGTDRLVSRIVRAVLTEKGANPFRRDYGSRALPGQTTAANVALQIGQVALAEAKRYAAGSLAPGERITGVRVDSVQDAGSPSAVVVDITIYTADGGATPATLTLPTR